MNKRIFVACSLMLCLAGCKKFSCRKDEQKNEPILAGEEVLVSVGDQPLLKLQELRQYIAEASTRDQNMAIMAQVAPNFEEIIFERAAFPRLIFNEWAKREKIAEKEEYKKEREKVMRVVKDMLNQERFVKAHVAEVTDSEVKKFYDENKDKEPGLMVNAGGVETKAVKFESAAKAQEFHNKVHSKGGNIEAVAKDHNLKLVDLGKVSAMTRASEAVKNAVLASKSHPALLPVINDGGQAFWVVKVFKREPVQYFPFEQVKAQLKEHVMARKIAEVVQQLIAKYEKEYGITINRSYFDRKRKEAEQKELEARAAAKKDVPATEGLAQLVK